SENPKLKISNKNRILSFCFIAILVSSAAVTPISVSPVFLQLVYAETMNDTNFVPSNQSNTVPTPTESWNFTASNLKTVTVGKARMDDSENTTALSLN